MAVLFSDADNGPADHNPTKRFAIEVYQCKKKIEIMGVKKIYNFLFMPYVPLLKLNFSFKVLFIPELILSLISTLIVLILNIIFSWNFGLSLKLMLFLIFQALYSLLMSGAKPLEKTNLEISKEFYFDKKIAVISLLSTTATILILLYLYQLLKSIY